MSEHAPKHEASSPISKEQIDQFAEKVRLFLPGPAVEGKYSHKEHQFTTGDTTINVSEYVETDDMEIDWIKASVIRRTIDPTSGVTIQSQTVYSIDALSGDASKNEYVKPIDGPDTLTGGDAAMAAALSAKFAAELNLDQFTQEDFSDIMTLLDSCDPENLT